MTSRKPERKMRQQQKKKSAFISLDKTRAEPKPLQGHDYSQIGQNEKTVVSN